MAGGIIKYAPVNGGTLISDFKSHFSIIRPRRTLALASVFLFIAFTIFLVFSPSSNSSSPWFTNIFTPPDHSYRSQFSSVFTYFFSNSSAPDNVAASPNSPYVVVNQTQVLPQSSSQNQTQSKPNQKFPDEIKSNQSAIGVTKSAETGNKTEAALPQRNQTPSDKIDVPKANQIQNQKFPDEIKSNQSAIGVTNSAETGNKTEVLPQSVSGNPTPRDKIDVPKGNQTQNKKFPDEIKSESNQSAIGVTKSGETGNNSQSVGGNGKSNLTSSLVKKQNSTSVGGGMDDLVKSLMKCDLFDGNWVRDESSYPLYKPDSCSLIDEQFNCFLNGRPDNGYHKLRWKPKDCTLPRLDGSRMLELLRGKRLVFVGDSLNRNMWESLICILRNSVKNQKKVYEEFGRHHFRTEASYSFVFEDYKCTVEFFVTPFLVQEWELRSKNGTKKETLRLDMVGRSADKYKNADIIVFNTGHWWTHEKTSLGKDYYQEGSHVYKELNVVEAFRKALTTWGRWVDANVNPRKSLVFFRGYSASHFSGGQWNSGGQCDHETEPIKNETYLTPYPQKMSVLEKVLKGMKTEVTYLNVTRMTDYRKDGHPSIYRKQHLSDEEKRSPLSFQDCSHWCLPGVPDGWNELLYAELLVKLNQRQQKKP